MGNRNSVKIKTEDIFDWNKSNNNKKVKNLIKIKKRDKYQFEKKRKKSPIINDISDTDFVEKYNFEKFSKQENSV